MTQKNCRESKLGEGRTGREEKMGEAGKREEEAC